MRVLIADDSVVSRRLLEGTLTKWNYEVVCACDGTEAWSILQRPDHPPLAILDWMMPGLTGLEICSRLRAMEQEPYVYVLLLTAKNLKADVIEGMSAGADDYLTKPFDQHELKVRLRAGRRIVDLQAELLAAREELREQATRDSLTKLWNRPMILDFLNREVDRSRRAGTTVGVAMADIDHFKSINDRYGHLAGDAVLQECARRLQCSTRSYDYVGRYGGEEFLMVLPGCNSASAATQAERLRCVIEREPIRLPDHEVRITVSFGMIAAIPSAELTATRLIQLADEGLYEAKRLGRNRVVQVYENRPLAAV